MFKNRYKEDACRAKVKCTVELIDGVTFEWDFVVKAYTYWESFINEDVRVSAVDEMNFRLKYNYWLKGVMTEGVKLEGKHYSPSFIKCVTYGEIEEYEV